MILPLSERAMRAIVCQLGTITLENGYYTDAGARVFRERAAFRPEELPAINVIEGVEVPNPQAGGGASSRDDSFSVSHNFAVEIHAVAESTEAAEIAALARADVKAALMSWAGPLGEAGVRDAEGQIGALSYMGHDRGARPEGSVSTYVSVGFIVHYKEGFGDPTKAL